MYLRRASVFKVKPSLGFHGVHAWPHTWLRWHFVVVAMRTASVPVNSAMRHFVLSDEKHEIPEGKAEFFNGDVDIGE